jgi:hypothetical protein
VLVSIYDIVATPPTSPFAIPVDEPMVAMVVLLLLHVPPGVPSVNVAVEPTHILYDPMINDGSGLMVTIAVEKQPVGIV